MLDIQLVKDTAAQIVEALELLTRAESLKVAIKEREASIAVLDDLHAMKQAAITEAHNAAEELRAGVARTKDAFSGWEKHEKDRLDAELEKVRQLHAKEHGELVDLHQKLISELQSKREALSAEVEALTKKRDELHAASS